MRKTCFWFWHGFPVFFFLNNTGIIIAYYTRSRKKEKNNWHCTVATRRQFIIANLQHKTLMEFLQQAIILFYVLSCLVLPASSSAGEMEKLSQMAEKGHAEAQFKLGRAFYAGKGSHRNPEQAALWYEKAAQQGHPEAQRALGAMYESGKGITKQPEKAVYWYEKAAAQGLARAQTNLGILHETGVGVAQNYDTARIWYEKAAIQGDARGQTYLGRIYELGIGVAVDFTQAFYWYEKAATQGYARAQTNLGALYEAGQGTKQNYEQAVAWYAKAAGQLYARGQFYLGRMFEQGLGVEKDLAQASEWYSKAAALGHVEAREQLATVKSALGKTDIKIQEQQEAAGLAQKTQATSARAVKELEESAGQIIPAKDKYLAAAETGNNKTAGMTAPGSKSDLPPVQAAEEHFHTGNRYAEDGQFVSAVAEYKKAIELDPNNSNTYENLAISLAETGNFQEALAAMQTALRLSPDDFMKYATLGIIYHADKKLEQAMEQYMRSLRLNPSYGMLYYNVAMIFSEFGQLENAYRFCLQAHDLGYSGSFQALVELQKFKPELPEISEKKKNVLHLRHIVTSTAAEAELVLRKLREGDDFIKLAAQYSLRPFNLNGGYLGHFEPHELMPVISKVVVPLAPLAFSPVIETGTGFHIFQKFVIDEKLLASW